MQQLSLRTPVFKYLSSKITFKSEINALELVHIAISKNNGH